MLENIKDAKQYETVKSLKSKFHIAKTESYLLQ